MQAIRHSCALQASALACRRGDRLLFAGLSLALEAGGACHIRGANGTGKTSLIRILAGLSTPWAGSVERRGAIGLIDDRIGFDPHQPLGRALHFWAAIDGHHCAAIERLGLSGLLDVPVRYLSSGQRRRAALARLIAQNAPIWLLDEPLNGLDGDAAALAMALVAEHRRTGGLCIVASHQPFAANAMVMLDLGGFAA